MMTLSLDAGERELVLSALHGKRVETEQYLASYRGVGEPGPADRCCDFHRHDYEVAAAQKLVLEKRLADVTELIARLEGSPS